MLVSHKAIRVDENTEPSLRNGYELCVYHELESSSIYGTAQGKISELMDRKSVRQFTHLAAPLDCSS
jgi:hypothetical protein